MRTITLEEHFFTAEAVKVTDELRDAGLTLSYDRRGASLRAVIQSSVTRLWSTVRHV